MNEQTTANRLVFFSKILNDQQFIFRTSLFKIQCFKFNLFSFNFRIIWGWISVWWQLWRLLFVFLLSLWYWYEHRVQNKIHLGNLPWRLDFSSVLIPSHGIDSVSLLDVVPIFIWYQYKKKQCFVHTQICVPWKKTTNFLILLNSMK